MKAGSAWFAINEAYEEEFDMTARRVADQDAPVMRFGVHWEESLELDRQREIEGLGEYIDATERAKWDAYTARIEAENLALWGCLPDVDDEVYSTTDEMDDGIRRIEEARVRVSEVIKQALDNGTTIQVVNGQRGAN